MNQGLLGYPAGAQSVDGSDLRFAANRWVPWTVQPVTAAPGSSTCGLASGNILAWPMIVSSPVWLNAWGMQTHTGQTGNTGATVTLGVYSGTAWSPGRLLAVCGTLTTTATGFVEYTITFPALRLEGPIVWVAQHYASYGATPPTWRSWGSTQVASTYNMTFGVLDNMLTGNGPTNQQFAAWKFTGVDGLPPTFDGLTGTMQSRNAEFPAGGFRIASPR